MIQQAQTIFRENGGQLRMSEEFQVDPSPEPFFSLWTACWDSHTGFESAFIFFGPGCYLIYSFFNTGLISTTGVPSIASSGPTWIWFFLIVRTVTR